MTDFDRIISEVAANISENEILTTNKNANALSEELKDQNGFAKLNMIAWDQQ